MVEFAGKWAYQSKFDFSKFACGDRSSLQTNDLVSPIHRKHLLGFVYIEALGVMVVMSLWLLIMGSVMGTTLMDLNRIRLEEQLTETMVTMMETSKSEYVAHGLASDKEISLEMYELKGHLSTVIVEDTPIPLYTVQARKGDDLVYELSTYLYEPHG